jgi:uncharacterized protein (DUF952 family)
MNFYHITTPQQWAKFDNKNFYEAESLKKEGFIHGSYETQLDESIALHYKNEDAVLLIKIDPSVLTAKLQVEPSRDGASFPHIYGQLNKSAIVYIIKRPLKAVALKAADTVHKEAKTAAAPPPPPAAKKKKK